MNHFPARVLMSRTVGKVEELAKNAIAVGLQPHSLKKVQSVRAKNVNPGAQ
jgi:hypothetical protein